MKTMNDLKRYLLMYLPYNVKVVSGDWYDEDDKLYKIGNLVYSYDDYCPNDLTVHELTTNSDGIFRKTYSYGRRGRVLLNPLECVLELDHKDVNCSAFEFVQLTNVVNRGLPIIADYYSFGLIRAMILNHIDVFNLIGQGLAINYFDKIKDED